MRASKLCLIVLATLPACGDKGGGLPATEADAAADSKLVVEDTSVAATEVAPATGGAMATGGVVGSGGSVGAGGASATGGTIGAGTTGALDAGSFVSLDASNDGWIGGTGASGGSGGSSTVAPTGTGGVSVDSGAGGAGVDGGTGMDGSTSSLLDLIPRSNSIPGWTIDPANAVTAGHIAAVATSQSEAEALIDGAAADFFAGPAVPTMFAWQNYVNPSLSPASGMGGSALSLYLLQMPGPQQACSLYMSLRQSAIYAATTWTDPLSPPIGTMSRITDSGSDWWINFCKGNYYVEVRMTPSYGPPPDYAPSNPAQKGAALSFAAAVAAKM